MEKPQVIKHKDILVLTTQQLAECYETTVDNIKHNFNRNKNRFIECKDFYLLKGDELKEFLQVTNSHLQISNKVRSMYLWTERGANRHSKILDTDKAWQQFDVLEETYFKVKNEMIPSAQTDSLSEKVLIKVLDTLDAVTANINNNTTIMANMFSLLNNQMNDKLPNDKVNKEDSADHKDTNDKQKYFEDNSFKNKVNKLLRAYYFCNKVNSRVVLKELYKEVREKFNLDLNKMKREFIKENDIESMSMLGFISTFKGNEVKNYITQTLEFKIEEWELNDYEDSLDKEESSFKQLIELLSDDTTMHSITYKIVYKKMEELYSIDWDLLRTQYREKYNYNKYSYISKIAIVRSNDDLTKKFNVATIKCIEKIEEESKDK